MFRVRFGNKFGAKRQEYGGKQYHSKKEAGYAAQLDLRVRAGDIKSWARQKRISLDVNEHHIADYYIDFVVTHNDGSIEYVEVKGFETPEWRMKWKLFEALYDRIPGVRLTVVK
jgi:hypothetical protein